MKIYLVDPDLFEENHRLIILFDRADENTVYECRLFAVGHSEPRYVISSDSRNSKIVSVEDTLYYISAGVGGLLIELGECPDDLAHFSNDKWPSGMMLALIIEYISKDIFLKILLDWDSQSLDYGDRYIMWDELDFDAICKNTADCVDTLSDFAIGGRGAKLIQKELKQELIDTEENIYGLYLGLVKRQRMIEKNMLKDCSKNRRGTAWFSGFLNKKKKGGEK